jgi:hypothetical protein
MSLNSGLTNAVGDNADSVLSVLRGTCEQTARKEFLMSHTQLEPEIRDIQERLQKMASENYADQFLQIIHRTGWTDTQAHLVRVTLDFVEHQLEGIDRAQRALIQAADEIGKARAKSA